MEFVQQQQRGYQRWRVKHVLGVGLVLLFSSLVFIWMVQWYSSTSFGARLTSSICEHYKKGVIGGSLCPLLCSSQSVRLIQHVGSDRQWQVFRWQGMLIKVNSIHGDPESLNSAGGSVHYAKPEKGTSMEDFRGMAQIFVEAKLGQGDHKIMLDAIMDKADANKDDKVSLAEAKSIWALLQHNEVFMSILFSDCEHIPKFLSFCGDNFAIEYIPNPKLYEKGVSVMENIFPSYYSWGFPSWNDRVKISVGLLEFTSEAYQHGTEGPFYMCSADEKTIGYTSGHDVKIMDLSHIISDRELSVEFNQIRCKKNSDCLVGTQCTSYCDKNRGLCSATGIRPNLHHICKVIEDYISLDARDKFREELSQLLQRCYNMKDNTKDPEVEHSLLLNDLKSVLWNQIS